MLNREKVQCIGIWLLVGTAALGSAALGQGTEMTPHVERANQNYGFAYKAFADAAISDSQRTLITAADAGWCEYTTIRDKLDKRSSRLMTGALVELGESSLNDPRSFTETLAIIRALRVGFMLGRTTGLKMMASQWQDESGLKEAYCHDVMMRAEELLLEESKEE